MYKRSEASFPIQVASQPYKMAPQPLERYKTLSSISTSFHRSIHTRNECGQTLLIRAIFIEDTSVRLKMIKAMLQAGCDVAATDAYKRNAVMWACIYRRDADVKVLLESGSAMDLLQSDIQGNTALHYAASSGSAGIVKCVKDHMVARGLDLDNCNNFGVTAGMESKRLGFDVCYSLLTNSPLSKPQSPDKTSADNSSKSPTESQSTSIMSLPPIISPEIKSRMDFLELKACRETGVPNPSEVLSNLCNTVEKEKKLPPKKLARSKSFQTSKSKSFQLKEAPKVIARRSKVKLPVMSADEKEENAVNTQLRHSTTSFPPLH